MKSYVLFTELVNEPHAKNLANSYSLQTLGHIYSLNKANMALKNSIRCCNQFGVQIIFLSVILGVKTEGLFMVVQSVYNLDVLNEK